MRRLRALALSLGLVAGPARAAGTLTLLTEAAPPWQTQGTDGEAAGPAVEVVREVQRRVGNRDPIRLVPWARGYATLQGQPNVALFLMARTKERNAQFQWVGPVVESVYGFYVKTDSNIVLKSLEDAKRLVCIGVVRDDARDQLLTQAGFANLDRTTDNVMNAKKLLAGRIDAMVSSHLGIGDLMTAAGAPREQVREALPIARIQFWIAFSKGTPEATVAAWSRAFDGMRKDRTLERILRREVPAWTPPGAPVTAF